MFKTVAFVALLAASCAASAATNTWTFTYTGFYDESAFAFNYDRTISGTFTGNDANLDGVIDKSEISSLLISGTDYMTCGAGGSPYFNCGAESFSYHIGGKKLDFVAGISSSDPEGIAGGAHYYETGQREWMYHYSPGGTTDMSYRWTDDTTLTVFAAPVSGAEIPAVPEPGTWAMLAAGLLVVSGASLRRRRN
jgi:hypothetical protein